MFIVCSVESLRSLPCEKKGEKVESFFSFFLSEIPNSDTIRFVICRQMPVLFPPSCLIDYLRSCKTSHCLQIQTDKLSAAGRRRGRNLMRKKLRAEREKDKGN